jgi:hypothetical protein
MVKGCYPHAQLPKLEDHPLSFVRGYLFNIFAATFHPQPEDPPCCGGWDPPNMAMQTNILEN